MSVKLIKGRHELPNIVRPCPDVVRLSFGWNVSGKFSETQTSFKTIFATCEAQFSTKIRQILFLTSLNKGKKTTLT